jgi:GH15 family glucan-1,4-alpha-glucosidase
VEFRIRIVPRFDYGEVRPWILHEADGTFSAIGGDEALVIATDADSIVAGDDHDLVIQLKLKEGERRRLSITFVRPYEFDWESPEALDPDELDARLEYTLEWWRRWATRAEHDGDVLRSAVVLRGLQHAATGAIVAAPTTSLPEAMGGARNWDYRYSWIRDSVFSVRSLAELGLTREADRFRRFVQRACAGHVEDLQIVYGVGGERRIGEQELDLEGYRASSPVRAGNGARDQTQLDAFGELLGLAWRWHRRGHSPGDDTWRFVCELVEAAVERWRQPDSGIWEWRGDPLHFVHSKVMCWSAIHRGLRLAEECERDVPATRWRAACREIREAVESEGYDSDRGVFVQAFGRADMDAALLLLPDTGFIAYDDERMIRTTDAIREELDFGGLLRRYTNSDGLGGDEGAFLACSFWLVECLARQGRTEDAREVYAKTMDARNDLGLFSEEYDPEKGEMLGNFPQALTHLAHIGAALAISSLSST